MHIGFHQINAYAKFISAAVFFCSATCFGGVKRISCRGSSSGRKFLISEYLLQQGGP